GGRSSTRRNLQALRARGQDRSGVLCHEGGGVEARDAKAEPATPHELEGAVGPAGATTTLEASVCDTNLVDTLYLCVDPGKDSPRFLGLDAELYFHAPEGTQLPRFWRSDDYETKGGPLHVIFDDDEDRGFVRPFNSPGMGGTRYDYTSGSGRLRWVY